MSSIAEQKNLLRQEMKSRRLAVVREKGNAAELIAEQLMAWQVIHDAQMVSLYWPLAGEIDPRLFMVNFHASGGGVALPVTGNQATSLRFYEWHPDTILSRSQWGVMEPAENGSPVQPDVVILPLLAFDNCGNRLGYGQGHYDCTLRDLRKKKKVLAVGIAFDFQKVALVPHEQHDQRLNYVVTPSTIYEF